MITPPYQSIIMMRAPRLRRGSWALSAGLVTGLRHDFQDTPDPAQRLAERIDRDMLAAGEHVAQHILE